jgi:hypothetical protein
MTGRIHLTSLRALLMYSRKRWLDSPHDANSDLSYAQTANQGCFSSVILAHFLMQIKSLSSESLKCYLEQSIASLIAGFRYLETFNRFRVLLHSRFRHVNIYWDMNDLWLKSFHFYLPSSGTNYLAPDIRNVHLFL